MSKLSLIQQDGSTFLNLDIFIESMEQLLDLEQDIHIKSIKLIVIEYMKIYNDILKKNLNGK